MTSGLNDNDLLVSVTSNFEVYILLFLWIRVQNICVCTFSGDAISLIFHKNSCQPLRPYYYLLTLLIYYTMNIKHLSNHIEKKYLELKKVWPICNPNRDSFQYMIFIMGGDDQAQYQAPNYMYLNLVT